MANLLVYIELVDDQATWSSLLALRQGRDLASKLGATLYAVLPCASPPLYGDNDIVAILSREGADKVILMTHTALGEPPLFRTHGDALLTAASQFPPALLLFPAGPAATDLAPRVAARIGALFVNRPLLHIDGDGYLEVTQPVFEGSHARRTTTRELEHPVVAVVSPEPRKMAQAHGSEEAEVVVISPGYKDAPPEQAQRDPETKGTGSFPRWLLLGDSAANEDCLDVCRKLARRMNADVYFTPRSAQMLGDRAHPILPSFSPGTLPGLCLAFGVAGNGEVLQRIPEDTYLVAIHDDRDAPIFSRAQIGLQSSPREAAQHMLTALSESPEPGPEKEHR